MCGPGELIHRLHDQLALGRAERRALLSRLLRAGGLSPTGRAHARAALIGLDVAESHGRHATGQGIA